jgi:hypothetical protein
VSVPVVLTTTMRSRRRARFAVDTRAPSGFVVETGQYPLRSVVNDAPALIQPRDNFAAGHVVTRLAGGHDFTRLLRPGSAGEPAREKAFCAQPRRLER